MQPIKITTLGTSHGNPTRTRFNSSVWVEANDTAILFDAGEPVTGLAIRAEKNFKALAAVCISHMHGDHTGGLSSLIKHLIKYSQGQRTVSFVLPESSAIPALTAWLQAQHIAYPSPVISLLTAQDAALIEPEGWRITAIRTDHLHRDGAPVSFAYRLDIEGRRICYTGDLSKDLHDFPLPEPAQPYDVCICEATHFDKDAARAVLERAAIKRMIFTHVGDRWHGAGEKDFWRWRESLPYPVWLAQDGSEFIV